MNYQDYIKTELFILIPVLYCMGTILKRSRFPDRWIPLVLGMISIILSAIWVISTESITDIKSFAYAFFTAVTQGILAAGASVYANQLYIQTKKDK